jgi:hypothetical protein
MANLRLARLEKAGTTLVLAVSGFSRTDRPDP